MNGPLGFCIQLPVIKRRNGRINSCLWFLQQVLFFLFFPLFLLPMKFMLIFMGDKTEWRKTKMMLTGIEGVFESGFQLMLQLFIIFSRSDRKPSTVQFLSILSSFISLVYARISYR